MEIFSKHFANYIYRLGRYVAYDANSETHAAGSGSKMTESISSIIGQSASAIIGAGSYPSNRETTGSGSVVSPASVQGSREAAWPSEAMADLHLSGSDPRMFPGIFTRGHRTGSSRNLEQLAEERLSSDEEPEEK